MGIDLFYTFWLLNFLFRHRGVSLAILSIKLLHYYYTFFVVSRKYFFCTWTFNYLFYTFLKNMMLDLNWDLQY